MDSKSSYVMPHIIMACCLCILGLILKFSYSIWRIWKGDWKLTDINFEENRLENENEY